MYNDYEIRLDKRGSHGRCVSSIKAPNTKLPGVNRLIVLNENSDNIIVWENIHNTFKNVDFSAFIYKEIGAQNDEEDRHYLNSEERLPEVTLDITPWNVNDVRIEKRANRGILGGVDLKLQSRDLCRLRNFKATGCVIRNEIIEKIVRGSQLESFTVIEDDEMWTNYADTDKRDDSISHYMPVLKLERPLSYPLKSFCLIKKHGSVLIDTQILEHPSTSICCFILGGTAIYETPDSDECYYDFLEYLLKNSPELKFLGLPYYFRQYPDGVRELLTWVRAHKQRHSLQYIDISLPIEPDTLLAGIGYDNLPSVCIHTHDIGYNLSVSEQPCEIQRVAPIYKQVFSNIEDNFRDLIPQQINHRGRVAIEVSTLGETFEELDDMCLTPEIKHCPPFDIAHGHETENGWCHISY